MQSTREMIFFDDDFRRNIAVGLGLAIFSCVGLGVGIAYLLGAL